MMKRDYLKPATRVVLLNTRVQLLTNSPTTTVTTNRNNAGLNEVISAGSGTARARSFDAWGDEEEEE
jgi:hypothetical protein